MVIPFEWENLSNGRARRAKVIGGWIVNTWADQSEALVFVPDPNHEWSVVDEKAKV